MKPVSELIDGWIERRVQSTQFAWFEALLAQAKRRDVPRAQVGVSSMPRRLGSGLLALTEDELTGLRLFDPELDLLGWTIDQLGRARIAMALGEAGSAGYSEVLSSLFEDADLGELLALYQALGLLPFPELHVARAAEGIRSNMKVVFEAVALRNPYPARALDEEAWNQLVLKCFFVESPSHRIIGFDRRANPRLARMLGDFVRERWAAGRAIAPELWRGVVPFAEGELRDLVRRAYQHGNAVERAAIVLSASREVLGSLELLVESELLAGIQRGAIDWQTISTRRLEG